MANRSPEFRRYQTQLGRLAADAYPKAIAETLNVVAGFAHVQQQRNVKERFVVRSAYTLGSFKFWKATPKSSISKINAVTGSVSPYLPVHEAGDTIKARSRKVPIPTLRARGGSKAGKIRRKYYAGNLGPDMFVGRPRGNPARPVGVYERSGRKAKRLRMIRNLESERIMIRPTRWHTSAVSRYARQSVIEAEFVRQARLALAAAGASG